MSDILFPSKFLVGAAVGSGGTALAAERGGADFILALDAGRFRIMGAPSIACMLPIRDSTELTNRFAREELLAQCGLPIFLGVNVWGEDIDPIERAEAIKADGFSGITNFPSCMLYPRPMQQILSRSGRGIEREVEQLSAARRVGLSTIFYCGTRTQARLAADQKLDFICLNLGWNTGGVIGHQIRESLEEAATTAREIGRLVKRISPETRFLLEGGPIATPEDLGRVISIAPIDGYIGGSTIERVPLEASVAEQIDGFRQAGARRADLDESSVQLVTWAKRFGLVGKSEMQIAFFRRLKALTEGMHPVLIAAEPGADLDPIAKVLRPQSSDSHTQSNKAVLQVNCRDTDFASRARTILFGRKDSRDTAPGALSDSEIGLLVLHEVDQLAPGLQRRLARALSDGFFRSSRGRMESITTRVIFTISRDLHDTARSGSVTLAAKDIPLDPALNSLLDGWSVFAPPLRNRSDDLIAVMNAYSRRSLNVAVQKSSFSNAALRALRASKWPRNEAGLYSFLGRIAEHLLNGTVEEETVITALSDEIDTPTSARSEKDLVVDALWRNGFSRTRTADALGVSRKTLYNKMKKFGLSG